LATSRGFSTGGFAILTRSLQPECQ
jgi:hypothetical protein